MRPLLYGAALCALSLSACFSPGDGVDPPLQNIYFPTGLALDDFSVDVHGNPAATHLYVASSDFDLQYKSSALFSIDLERFRHLDPNDDRDEVVPRSCNDESDCVNGKICDNVSSDTHVASHFCVADLGMRCPFSDPHQPERPPALQLLYPGLCNPVDITPLQSDWVGIGAFATDIVYRRRPADDPAHPELDPQTSFPGRLFVPVRGDATLHWLEVDEQTRNGVQIECGQDHSSSTRECDDGHRAGKKASESPVRLRMLPEPFGADATADGRQIVVTNQTSGALSLFDNAWSSQIGSVRLTDQLGGLPLAPVTLAAVPETSSEAQPGFLVGYSDAAQIDLVRVDRAPGLGYPLIYYSGTAAITANSIGSDSRDIAIDASRGPDMPPRVFVSNRAPPSLLAGELRVSPERPGQATDDLPALTDSIPLSSGPSRVALGYVNGPDDQPVLRVFVVCFDTRQIFIYDPKLRQIEAEVRTGRGPYAIAIDSARHLAYVAHFTDSYLGVISLDQRYPDTYATIVATIGNPTPPRASK